MLDPNKRELYSDALRPPSDYQFDCAIGATYSLDLQTLVTVPLHLALFASGEDVRDVAADGITVLEAVRRTAEHLTVFAHKGRTHPPGFPLVLYSLLEPVVVEVPMPNGGSFHPKLWVLRFTPRSGDGRPLIRVLILTRNITADRSWDLSLVLEGTPKGRRRADNRELRDLIAALPDLARLPSDAPARERALILADEVHRTEWELPEGFDDVVFHALLADGREWLPPVSRRLAVVSPFCGEAALRELSETTDEPVAFIGVPEELDRLDPAAFEAFDSFRVLNPGAEAGDSEDSEEGTVENRGLHAKAYVLENGWDTHVIVGSANATNAALLAGRNVELLAELIGKRSRVGGVDDLLGPDGLGPVLMDYTPPPEPVAPDPDVEAAERALEAARDALCAAGLRLACVAEGEHWRLELRTPDPVALDGIHAARVWPVTSADSASVDALPLAQGEPVALPPAPLEGLTGFLAFELRAAAQQSIRFVLNVPVDGLPPGRTAAVFRAILKDRDGFLRYLMLLLAGLGDDDSAEPSLITKISHWGPWSGPGPLEALPLVEELTRALCRDPGRLRAIRRALEDLRTHGGGDVVPPEFLELWDAYEAALAGGAE